MGGELAPTPAELRIVQYEGDPGYYLFYCDASGTEVTEEQAASFDERGFVVLEDQLDSALLRRVTGELDAYEANLEAFLRTQTDERMMIAEAGAITFNPHLVARSEIARTFATHDIFVDLCADLLGPDADLYWDQS